MISEPQDDGRHIEPDHSPMRVHHLELIQAVVTRLAGNSATMKRYSIALIALGAGVYSTIGERQAIPVLILVVLVFWFLDARYLEDEKRFRHLYDQVRVEPTEQRPDFRLRPEGGREIKSFLNCMLNWSTTPLYSALLVMLLLFWIAT